MLVEIDPVKRLALASLLVAAPVSAQPTLPPPDLANTELRDPTQEAQARSLMVELRCLVCQGQSIADSDADMAGDMRALVRDRVRRGEPPAAIRRWLIQRYGDYVTYDPPLSGATALLWGTPLALLAIGALVARVSFKRRRSA